MEVHEVDRLKWGLLNFSIFEAKSCNLGDFYPIFGMNSHYLCFIYFFSLSIRYQVLLYPFMFFSENLFSIWVLSFLPRQILRDENRPISDNDTAKRKSTIFSERLTAINCHLICNNSEYGSMKNIPGLRNGNCWPEKYYLVWQAVVLFDWSDLKFSGHGPAATPNPV